MGRPVVYTKDLIIEIATEQGKTLSTVAAIVQALRDKIIERVAHGQAVCISGLGRFSHRRYTHLRKHNINTGETAPVAPFSAPTFKAGDTFKEAVRALG